MLVTVPCAKLHAFSVAFCVFPFLGFSVNYYYYYPTVLYLLSHSCWSSSLTDHHHNNHRRSDNSPRARHIPGVEEGGGRTLRPERWREGEEGEEEGEEIADPERSCSRTQTSDGERRGLSDGVFVAQKMQKRFHSSSLTSSKKEIEFALIIQLCIVHFPFVEMWLH